VIDLLCDEATSGCAIRYRLYSLSDLIEMGDGVRVWVVTARSEPLLLLTIPPGYLLCQAVVGVGKGLRNGLAQGVRYRLLKLLKVPDEIIRESD